jgi:hypothetical protein
MSLHLKSLLDDRWLLSTSHESAEYSWRIGRISDEQWDAYEFLWTWGATRFGGRAGCMHDMFFERFGARAHQMRMKRVRGWIEAAKKLASKE